MTDLFEPPTVNTELFTKIHDLITLNPEKHYNMAWEVPNETRECNTTRCIAGWALWFQNPENKSIRDTLNESPYTSFSQAGRELLGLTEHEADYLFHASDDEAVEMVAHYAEHGREGWEYPEYYA